MLASSPTAYPSKSHQLGPSDRCSNQPRQTEIRASPDKQHHCTQCQSPLRRFPCIGFPCIVSPIPVFAASFPLHRSCVVSPASISPVPFPLRRFPLRRFPGSFKNCSHLVPRTTLVPLKLLVITTTNKNHGQPFVRALLAHFNGNKTMANHSYERC